VFDAIALATGPTVVNSLVRQMRLPPFLSQVLEAEGLLLEPFSAVLALLLLQSALGDVASWPDQAQRLVAHFGWGGAVGALKGGLKPLRMGVVQVNSGGGAPGLDGRKKLLLGWVAPGGIVSAVAANLFALQLEGAGIEGAGPSRDWCIWRS
jgi:NhaP-type Na+/H+ or K+/H+ antiporter